MRFLNGLVRVLKLGGYLYFDNFKAGDRVLFVDDVVRGTVLAMEKDKAIGEIINLGNNEEMSVLDCAKLIHKLSGSENKLKIHFIPFEEIFGNYKDIMRRIPDLTKAKKLLGYTPKIEMRDAILLTIEKVFQELEN